MCPEGPEFCKITARGIRTFPAPPYMSRCPRGRLGERGRRRRGDRANRSLYAPMRIPGLLLACSARRRIGFENHFSHKLSAYIKAQKEPGPFRPRLSAYHLMDLFVELTVRITAMVNEHVAICMSHSSKRRSSHNHQHCSHNQGYHQNCKYALHYVSPPFILFR